MGRFSVSGVWIVIFYLLLGFDIPYMQNLKRNDTSELIYKIEITHRLREGIYGFQLGRMGGTKRWGVWDGHVHTAIFKMDNQQVPTISQGTLLNVT